jgi:hypothetical protein
MTNEDNLTNENNELDEDSFLKLETLINKAKLDQKPGHTHSEAKTNEFIKVAWTKLTEKTQAKFKAQLSQYSIRNLENGVEGISADGKVGKLANAIVRSLASHENLDDALTNLSSQDIRSLSDIPLPFSETFGESNKTFKKILDETHPELKNASTAINGRLGNHVLSKEYSDDEKEQLFSAMGNVFVGVVTKKNLFHSRKKDPSILETKGGTEVIEGALAIAVANYVDQNFDQLKNLDIKSQRAIGTALKNVYLKLTKVQQLKPEEIAKAFKPIPATDRITLAQALSSNIVKEHQSSTINGQKFNKQKETSLSR